MNPTHKWRTDPCTIAQPLPLASVTLREPSTTVERRVTIRVDHGWGTGMERVGWYGPRGWGTSQWCGRRGGKTRS
eukprot:767751-Hanusia_phi.AAC.3